MEENAFARVYVFTYFVVDVQYFQIKISLRKHRPRVHPSEAEIMLTVQSKGYGLISKCKNTKFSTCLLFATNCYKVV